MEEEQRCLCWFPKHICTQTPSDSAIHSPPHTQEESTDIERLTFFYFSSFHLVNTCKHSCFAHFEEDDYTSVVVCVPFSEMKQKKELMSWKMVVFTARLRCCSFFRFRNSWCSQSLNLSYNCCLFKLCVCAVVSVCICIYIHPYIYIYAHRDQRVSLQYKSLLITDLKTMVLKADLSTP